MPKITSLLVWHKRWTSRSVAIGCRNAFRIHHLRFSKGSDNELQTQVELAKRMAIITEHEAAVIIADAEKVGRMLQGLMNSLERFAESCGERSRCRHWSEHGGTKKQRRTEAHAGDALRARWIEARLRSQAAQDGPAVCVESPASIHVPAEEPAHRRAPFLRVQDRVLRRLGAIAS